MTGNGDGLFPASYAGLHGRSKDRSAEYCSIQNGPYGAIWALPLLLQAVFLHSVFIGSDGGTLYTYSQPLDGFSTFHSDLVICVVPIGKREIIVFALQVHEGKDQLILNHLPEDSCHFVPIDFNQGSLHLYLLHYASSFISFSLPPFRSVFFCTSVAKRVRGISTPLVSSLRMNFPFSRLEKVDSSFSLSPISILS